MHGIRIGEGGAGHGYPKKDDAIESSWGPFQLNRRRGLGVQFERETGLDVRDPSTIAAQARWVAEYIAKHGPRGLRNWMGYRGPRDTSSKWGDLGYKPSEPSSAEGTSGAFPAVRTREDSSKASGAAPVPFPQGWTVAAADPATR